MLEKIAGNKKVYELSEEECKKLLEAAEEAMVNIYPERNDGFAVALMNYGRQYLHRCFL